MAAERGWYRWYALGLLAAINVLNYLDRNIIFALFEPIKRDLALTDTQLGWLGSAYILVFSLAALPFGVLSDLRSRRAVIAVGVAVWSAFTSLAGLVRSFTQLFICRAAVGIGEAAFGPASSSIVADYFAGPRRAMAMGILSAGVPLGGVLGLWLGGQLEALYGWRVAFLAVGVPGFLLAVLAGNLRDPCRPSEPVLLRKLLKRFELGLSTVMRHFAPLIVFSALGAIAAYALTRYYGADSKVDAAVLGSAVGLGLALNIAWWFVQIRKDRIADTPFGPEVTGPVGDAFDELVGALRVVLRTPTLVFVFLSGAMISFGMNGLVGWGPTFAARELGWTAAEASTRLGGAGLIVGTLGTLAGGFVADWLKRYTESARVLTTGIGLLIGGPLALWTLMVRHPAEFVPLFSAAFFFLTWYNGPLAATIFDVVPARISATVVGAYLLFIHLAGDAIALPLVGILSDRIGIDKAVLVLPVVSILGGGVVLLAMRYVRRDMARASLPTAEFQAVI
ncbi:MAG TPA: MFS transporter [Gemmatimonadales bacterium]|nr:MFS transporter [Gemmatimonadales bacterium]